MTKSTSIDSILNGTAKPDSMVEQVKTRLMGTEESKPFPIDVAKGGKIRLLSKD